MKRNKKRKCVFFDRDGIVNEAPFKRYVEKWQEFRLKPEFPVVLRIVTEKGYDAIVVTNQKGIAVGALKKRNVEYIHRKLREKLEKEHGLSLLDIVYCPHDDNECLCRKPKPGMLLASADKYGIDLKKSWMIGDQERDVEAGINAGCKTILVDSQGKSSKADFTFGSLSELAIALPAY